MLGLLKGSSLSGYYTNTLLATAYMTYKNKNFWSAIGQQHQFQKDGWKELNMDHPTQSWIKVETQLTMAAAEPHSPTNMPSFSVPLSLQLCSKEEHGAAGNLLYGGEAEDEKQ